VFVWSVAKLLTAILLSLDFLRAAVFLWIRLVLTALSSAEKALESVGWNSTGLALITLRKSLRELRTLSLEILLNSRFLSEERSAFLADLVFGINKLKLELE